MARKPPINRIIQEDSVITIFQLKLLPLAKVLILVLIIYNILLLAQSAGTNKNLLIRVVIFLINNLTVILTLGSHNFFQVNIG